VVNRLDQAMRAAINDPAIQRRIQDLGSIPAATDRQGPEALRTLVRSEVGRWAEVVRAAGIPQQ
jgi:tripartite-type tricarboxylate transporter receptor subunit TctC